MEKIPQHVMDYLKAKDELMQQRKAKLKKGPNVVQLRYLSQHISPEELSTLEKAFQDTGLELSAMDTSGIPKNSISSLSADLILTITEPGISGVLLSGLLTNGLYDGLKALLIKCWFLVKGKPTVSITSHTVTEYPAKFHLVIKNGNQMLEFKTENLSEENIGPAIDRISKTLIDLKKEERNVFEYSIKSNLWQPLDINIDYLKQPQEGLRQIPLEAYLAELRKKENS